jgi:hypothetical protein
LETFFTKLTLAARQPKALAKLNFRLQENADVFCGQIGLIQDDFSSSNPEVAVGAAQQVMTGADEKILVLLQPSPIAQKIRLNFNFRSAVVLDPNVGNEVTGSRWRHLGPSIFRVNPLDPNL